MGYSTDEQETTCVYDYASEKWTVYSCVRKHITKLLRRFGEPEWKEEEPDKYGSPRIIAARWKVPGNTVRFVSNPAQNQVWRHNRTSKYKTITSH